ncbi:MAG: helix-turn-helix transcriptional regulator [Planctomycetes bacterium]|nr:helix-turn-helix transcriptional regulator [Planctomycetota bacterium]
MKVAQVIHYIEQHYSKTLNLQDLARIAKLSENRLIILFKEAMGKTPMDYIIDLRLRKAGELLRSSPSPITKIAFQVGYDDSNYFTRQFKKRIGLSPRDYRKKGTLI